MTRRDVFRFFAGIPASIPVLGPMLGFAGDPPPIPYRQVRLDGCKDEITVNPNELPDDFTFSMTMTFNDKEPSSKRYKPLIEYVKPNLEAIMVDGKLVIRRRKA